MSHLKVMVMYDYGEDESMSGECDLSHLWPFVPRIGDTFNWREGDDLFEGTVTSVEINQPGLSDGFRSSDVFVVVSGRRSWDTA